MDGNMVNILETAQKEYVDMVVKDALMDNIEAFAKATVLSDF